MRRTKAAQIYRKTGNLRAAQLLLGIADFSLDGAKPCRQITRHLE